MKLIRHILTVAALGAAVSTFPSAALAQANPSGSSPATASAAAEMTEAEVRKVDKENKKITLKHGVIKNLDMPAMTMVFGVKEDAFLDKVQAGDKVRFKASGDGGKFTVTEIQTAR